MQKFGGESLTIGNVFIWRVKTLVAICCMNENLAEEAIEILNSVVDMQTKCFNGTIHYTFEYTYNQL